MCYLCEAEWIHSLCEIILSLRDKIKHVFIVPIVRQVALDNVPLRNGPSSQKFGEGPMFIFLTVKIDHNYANKMVDFTDRRLWKIT